MIDDIDTETQKIFDEFMSLPCTLPHVTGELTGFATDDEANKLQEYVSHYLNIFGRLLCVQQILAFSIHDRTVLREEVGGQRRNRGVLRY